MYVCVWATGCPTEGNREEKSSWGARVGAQADQTEKHGGRERSLSNCVIDLCFAGGLHRDKHHGKAPKVIITSERQCQKTLGKKLDSGMTEEARQHYRLSSGDRVQINRCYYNSQISWRPTDCTWRRKQKPEYICTWWVLWADHTLIF